MATGAHVLDEVVPRRPHGTRNDLLWSGGAGGLLAGGAMMGWAIAASASAGLPPSRAITLTAATFLGRDALEGGVQTVLAGALLWFVVSVALALVFGAVIPRDFPFGSAAILGVGYSFFVLAFMTSSLLPRVNTLMLDEMQEMGGAWVLAYAVFGVGLAFVPLLRRRRGRGEPGAT